MKLQRKVGLVGLFTAVLYLGNLGVALPADAHGTLPSMQARGPEHVDHVLLLSIDGMHEADLERLVQTEPRSALAWLTHQAVQYKHAATTKPSDSFPGLLSMVTGGTPRTTGVYYDDSYDRTLAPAGSDCSQRGTEVAYDESLDKNPNALDAGGGIDPSTLPRDPAHGCTPLYPHQYLRVNTIFEVVKAAGGHTAWADKHPAYEILNGPSGKGVDDLFTPEIAADGITDSVAKTEAYDDRKVQAILNEIGGRDHTGRRKVGVPTLFGMNFQAVSVAQKLPGGGYRDAAGTPSGMQRQVQDHTDRSIGRIVDKARIPAIVNGVAPGLLAHATEDDVALLWLTDSSKTSAVAAALNANRSRAAIASILAGRALARRYDDPRRDPRTPDLVVLPQHGVIYTSPTNTKIAEHGGFSADDTHVPLLVANLSLQHRVVEEPVQTTQIAPTILQALGLKPQMLRAVGIEHTHVLPYIDLRSSTTSVDRCRSLTARTATRSATFTK